MPYQDYFGSRPSLALRESESESRASGWKIGRLEAWPRGSATAAEIMDLIEKSGLDIVILRASADDDQLGALLHSDLWMSWQADTLMYYEASATILGSAWMARDDVRLVSADVQSASALTDQVFADYRNHYSSNPLLHGVSVVAAYRDWTVTSLSDPDKRVLRVIDADGLGAGICVIDVANERYDEILLAGTVPALRRQGIYREMLRIIGGLAKRHGKESVVISTQAANVPVTRAWCRSGFAPTIAINTFHIVRRAVYARGLSGGQGRV